MLGVARNAHLFWEKNQMCARSAIRAIVGARSIHGCELYANQIVVFKVNTVNVSFHIFRGKSHWLHTSATNHKSSKDEYNAKIELRVKRDTQIVSRELFDDSEGEKNRETFKNAIELFNRRDKRKRGAVEFIYAALKNMKQFDCHR